LWLVFFLLETLNWILGLDTTSTEITVIDKIFKISEKNQKKKKKFIKKNNSNI